MRHSAAAQYEGLFSTGISILHQSRATTSIAEFGFVNPVLIGGNDVIIAGHGRLLAARRLGMTEVLVNCTDHLSEAQRRALVIADSRIADGNAMQVVTVARGLNRISSSRLRSIAVRMPCESHGKRQKLARPKKSRTPNPQIRRRAILRYRPYRFLQTARSSHL